MSFSFVQQDYIHKVRAVLCVSLRRESHKPHGPLPQLLDCSCYVSSLVLDPVLLQLQKHADIRANDLTHSPSL